MLTLQQARAWYTDEDPVHDFSHIERVYRLAEKIAVAEGADLEIVRTAALLHDVEGSLSGSEERANHHEFSSEFAARILAGEGWSPERIRAVQHCIRAHRFRGNGENPATPEAKVLFDADKLDVLGAIGVARTMGYAAMSHQPFYVQPSQTFLDTGKEEPGEPHSSYHEFLFKLSKIRDRLYTASARKIAEDRHRYISEYYERLAAETRGEA